MSLKGTIFGGPAFDHVRIKDVKVGTVLIPDGDFTCMTMGRARTVHEDENGLYVGCRSGKHYLDGQIEGDRYIGLTTDGVWMRS